MNSIDIENRAADLYHVYAREVGGRAFNGDVLPDWKEFGSDPKKKAQADGWRQVARLSCDLAIEGGIPTGVIAAPAEDKVEAQSPAPVLSPDPAPVKRGKRKAR